jgi:uncharacterized protein YdeI (YjbR/CyaY-like superfamily)
MATPLKDKYERVYLKDRKAWRKWLEKHHASAPGIWLISPKKATGKPRIEYNDAVEEALCYGWIDSTMLPIDAEFAMQLFTPRKPKSNWAKSNKERVARLIAQQRMTPAGLAKIEEAKRNGSWTALDAVEKLIIPPELKKALSGAEALRNFKAFAPSVQKQMLYFLNSAKREETRAARIEKIVASAVAKKNLL